MSEEKIVKLRPGIRSAHFGRFIFVTDALFPRLAHVLARPDAQLLTAPEDLLAYSFDGTPVLHQMPRAVVFPTTPEEVAGVLKLASEDGFPVVTRGSGTGLSGGSIPTPGAVVLCLTKMDRLLEVDTANLTLLAEPGVITLRVSEEAERVGLFYPPDPGSMKISSIGGNVAENSGGLRGLKYGVTRDYVMALEVVLSTGEIVWTGNKCVKDVAGYSLKDLFIGSEGTLGVITKVLLKLIPKPAARKTLLASFDRMDAAAAVVSALIAAKIIPCTLEFLDRVTIRCVEDFAHLGLPLDAEAVLLMETDGHPAAVEEEAAAMERFAREGGAREVHVAKDAAEAAKLASARRNALPAVARVAPTTILEDVTVPRSRLAEMVRFCQETAARHGLKVAIFGHMGDGNLHPTFLTDERDTDEMHRVELALTAIFDEALRLGGTITGEHGVGLAKKSVLPRAIGDLNLRVSRDLKRAFDPRGILNPGKMFDL